jgi:hypothetical protein
MESCLTITSAPPLGDDLGAALVLVQVQLFVPALLCPDPSEPADPPVLDPPSLFPGTIVTSDPTIRPLPYCWLSVRGPFGGMKGTWGRLPRGLSYGGGSEAVEAPAPAPIVPGWVAGGCRLCCE